MSEEQFEAEVNRVVLRTRCPECAAEPGAECAVATARFHGERVGTAFVRMMNATSYKRG